VRRLEDTARDLLEGDEPEQARRVFGPHNGAEVAAAIESFVEAAVGSSIAHCGFDYVSVGVTLELELSDGRTVVFKAAPHDPSGKRGDAIATQSRLAAHGFPAPAVLSPLTRCLQADAYLMSRGDRGVQVRYGADVLVEMAQTLARLVDMAAAIEPPPDAPVRGYVSERLWPTPHAVIFDIEGTRETAGAIDAIASRARDRLADAGGHLVLAHGDWSLQNVAFRDGKIVCVFDWDSMALMPEPLIAASAAAFHQQDWVRTPKAYAHDFYPGPDVALAFVDAYAVARGLSWDHRERRLVEAALVHRLGYQARCEHALDPVHKGPAQARLQRFADAFDL